MKDLEYLVSKRITIIVWKMQERPVCYDMSVG